MVSWPEEYGGRDASLLEWLVFEEEYYAAAAPVRVGQNGLFLLAPTLFAHGTAEQRDRLLPPMARADQVWAQAWSEPEAGSDLAAIRSSAARTDGGWLLSGTKTWSTRAAFADKAFGLFRSDPGAGRHRGLTYLMFDLRADGVTVRPIRQLGGETGFAARSLSQVCGADVVAGGPAADSAAARAFEAGVLAAAAQLLGTGRALLDAGVRHARQRTQFGQPIGAFQAVKHHLADMAIGLEFARPLLDAAALALAAGAATAPRDVSAAKVACADSAHRAARAALQVHGAIGYTQEHDLHLWLTKVRALAGAWGSQAWHRARVMAAIAAGGELACD